MFTLRLIEAAAPRAEPVAAARVRIAALDDTGRERQPPLVDGYTNRAGAIAFVADPPRRRIGAAPLPRVKVTVEGLDGEELLSKTLQLEQDRPDLVEKVPMAQHLERLAGPLDVWERELRQSFSPELARLFQQHKIVSLADLRAARALEREPGLAAGDIAQIALLRAHADLQLVSRSPRVTQALIDANYRDVLAIADARRDTFVDALTRTIGAKTAGRVYEAAHEKVHLLSNLSTEVRVAQANGYAVKDSVAGETPPCGCECQSAVSPLAYLTDLLEYAIRHVTYQNVPVTVTDLETHFAQPFGDLPTDCDASAVLVRQVRICIETLLRKHPSAGDADTRAAYRLHVLDAYDALLREVGTSLRELRLVRGAPPADRQALADRLGSAGTQGESDARLARLRLALDGAGASQLSEAALERLFGFQDTRRDPLSTSAKSADDAGQLVRWRVQGVAWNRNTDGEGRLYASLVKSGSQHQVRLFRDARRRAEDLVASGSSARATGEVVLTAQNGSGLTARVDIAYQSDSATIELAAVPELLAWRLAALRAQWRALDAAPADASAAPIIDPDVLPETWIVSTSQGDAAFALLQQRRAQLDALLAVAARVDTEQELDRILTATPLPGGGGVAIHALGFADGAELDAMAAAIASGASLPVDVERRGLTVSEAVALVQTRELARAHHTDPADWTQVHHILVQAEKRRHLFRTWRQEEASQGLVLSPDFFRVPAPSPHGFLAPPPPADADPIAARARAQWRVDTARRRDWERTLAERLDQQNAATESLRTAVDRAEEATLPGLRDRLIRRVVPLLAPVDGGTTDREQHDWVTNQLLIHASEGACRKTTRTAQAIETLQLLIHGTYTGLFEKPGFRIDHSVDYGDGMVDDLFPDAWRWLGSYATWRAAMFVFLYPENLLLPTFRRQQSPLFRAFVDVVARPFEAAASDEDEAASDDLPPDPARELAAKLRTYVGAQHDFETVVRTLYYSGVRILRGYYESQYTSTLSTDAEHRYYMPMHLALTLHRRGSFEGSLYWFRQLFDFAGAGLKGSVAAVLPDQQGLPAFVRQEDWYDDALNPHAIAATRAGVDLRFILLALIRCLLDYADAEFAADNAESLARARELYLTAERLLGSEPLERHVSDCPGIVGALTIKIGDDRWRRIVIGIIRDVLGEALDDLPATFDPDRLATEIDDIVGRGSRLSDLEKRVRVRQVLAKHLDRPRPGALDTRRVTSQSKRAAAFRRLMDDEGVFALLQKADPGTSPRRRRGRAGTAAGAVLDGPKFQGSVIEIFVPAPAFDFCVPRNPMLHVLGLRVAVGLFKLRHCLNAAGLAREVPPYVAPTDAASGLTSLNAAGQIGLPPAARPPLTPYRYKVLIERTRHLVEFARQMEASFLGFLEKRDQEAYTLLRARQDLEMASATVTLQDLRRTEAEDQRDLARLQRERVEMVRDHYQDLLDAGLSANEMLGLGFLITGALIQNAVAIAGIAAAGGASSAFSGLIGGAGTLGSGALPSAVVGGLLGAAGGALAGSIVTGGAGLVTASSVFNTLASFERRAEEWAFQRDLAADHELPIAAQQETLAGDRIDIVQQEYDMARLSTDHASDVVRFLDSKFTNVELFDWMSGVLGGVYRYFLEQATAMAKLAEAQLAFERQEAAAGIILSDYWTVAPAGGASTSSAGAGTGTASSADRRGLTGSARLLQDVTRLDQQAFLTDRRTLQLTRPLSLAAHDPVAFQRFRESGVLPFATPLALFDGDFPGHYLRLIKRVRVSVIALVPPGTGIRATLSSSGVSYVVRGRDLFERVVIVRPPESVALSAAMHASGVFELQEQPELLLPFEGSGVETSWEFRLPRAANPFDYATIADVVISIDYTAFDSPLYRQQVIETLNPSVSAVRAFSFRQHFADAWYDLHHPDLADPAQRMVARFETRRADFPRNVEDLRIEQVTLYLASRPGSSRALEVAGLRFTPAGAAAAVGGAASSAADGLIGTRQGNAASWLPMVGQQPMGAWELALPDTDAMRARFRNNEIDDLLFVLTYGGRLPAWPA